MSKKLMVLILIIFAIVVGIWTAKLFVINNNSTNNRKYIEKNSIGEKILNAKNKVAKNIQVYDKTNEDCLINSNEVELYKTIGNIEEDEKIIENIIFSAEAKKRNINLSSEQIDRINNLADSNEFSYNIENEDDKEYIKEKVYEYLESVEYDLQLKKQILEEIKNDNIKIKDPEIEALEKEYINLQKEASTINDDKQKKEYFAKILSKIAEIQNIYYAKIKENYIVEKD